MASGVYIEEALFDVLKETDLLNFERKLCVELQLMRLEHFDHVTDDELKAYANLSQPAVRRLRLAIAEKKKKAKKSKGLFSTIGRKEGKEVSKVVLAQRTVEDTPSGNQKGTTCLITKDQIRLAERLGEGSFAVVKRAIWTDSEGKKRDVAVKILRDATPEVIEDLQSEVNNMNKLQHPNLIRLYGIVFSSPAMMVVEFCDGGSLIDLLRDPAKPVMLVSVLLEYAQQIAKGMAYLESKHCVHRDLAARNVLLTDNGRTVKICDFGLMRALEENERLYVMSAQKKVPFAWCPPESLRRRQFSHASDVWAFGVTLWEMFSYGEEPWAGCRAAEVLAKMDAGENLSRPQKCSNEVFDVMASCWLPEPEQRPRFSLLKGLLSEIKFMIAECRESIMPSSDLDLEMRSNDRIIVIDGSGSVWYGQNIRTRRFGSFQRSSIHARSERNPTSAANNGMINTISSNGTVISKPVPGSFIHAGHGDIQAGNSWGQPERIDDIYLKNPILRKDAERNGNAPRSLGPQIIASVIDMRPAGISYAPTNEQEIQPPSMRPKPALPPTGPVASSLGINPSRSIDPFAPFSEYDFDAYSAHTFNDFDQQSMSNENGSSDAQFNAPTQTYDEPPLSTNYDLAPSTSASRITTETLGSNLGEQCTALTMRSTPNIAVASSSMFNKKPPGASHTEQASTSSASPVPVLGPVPLIPPPANHPKLGSGSASNSTSRIAEYASLPRPKRTSPELGTMNGGRLGRPSAGSTPPPIRAEDFTKRQSTPAAPILTPLGAVSQPPASLFMMGSRPNDTQNVNTLDKTSKKHNTSAPTLTGTSTVNNSTSSTFRATSYLAQTAREVHNAKSPVNVVEQRDRTVNSSDGAVNVHRETVFGVIPPVTPAESPATVSGLSNIQITPPQGTRPTHSNVGVLSGPDPFEISSSVKRITNRNRYSEVFANDTQQNIPLYAGTWHISHSTVTSSANVPQVSLVPQPAVSRSPSTFPQPQVSLVPQPTISPASSPQSMISQPVVSRSPSGVSRSPSNVSRSPTTFPQPQVSSSLSPSNVPISQIPRTQATDRSSASRYAGLPSLLPPPSPLLLGDTGTGLGTIGATNVSTTPSISNSVILQPTLSPIQSTSTQQPLSNNSTLNNHINMTSSNYGYTNAYVNNAMMRPGQHIMPNHTFYAPQQRIMTHMDSTPILEGYSRVGAMGSLAPSTPYASLGSSMNTINTNSSYNYQYFQQSPHLASIATRNNVNASMNRPAFVYDANLSNSSRSTIPPSYKPTASTSSVGVLQPTRLTQTTQRHSVMNDEILGMFDPLASSTGPSTSRTQPDANTSTDVKQPGDLVNMVLKNALFAGRDKCTRMLQRCQNDANRAVQELKTDELLAMGIAQDRAQAVSALNDCRWDLNAAAAALIA